MSQKHHDASHHSQRLTNLQFFSIAEVAAILGVSRKLVRQWIHPAACPSFALALAEKRTDESATRLSSKPPSA